MNAGRASPGLTRQQALGTLGALTLPWDRLFAQANAPVAAPVTVGNAVDGTLPPDRANLYPVIESIVRDHPMRLSFLNPQWRRERGRIGFDCIAVCPGRSGQLPHVGKSARSGAGRRNAAALVCRSCPPDTGHALWSLRGSRPVRANRLRDRSYGNDRIRVTLTSKISLCSTMASWLRRSWKKELVHARWLSHRAAGSVMMARPSRARPESKSRCH